MVGDKGLAVMAFYEPRAVIKNFDHFVHRSNEERIAVVITQHEGFEEAFGWDRCYQHGKRKPSEADPRKCLFEQYIHTNSVIQSCFLP
jgi:hypothetical protein